MRGCCGNSAYIGHEVIPTVSYTLLIVGVRNILGNVSVCRVGMCGSALLGKPTQIAYAPDRAVGYCFLSVLVYIIRSVAGR